MLATAGSRIGQAMSMLECGVTCSIVCQCVSARMAQCQGLVPGWMRDPLMLHLAPSRCGLDAHSTAAVGTG
jgi:hypothetical protein